jgi:hypothetical protein
MLPENFPKVANGFERITSIPLSLDDHLQMQLGLSAIILTVVKVTKRKWMAERALSRVTFEGDCKFDVLVEFDLRA